VAVTCLVVHGSILLDAIQCDPSGFRFDLTQLDPTR